MDRKENRHLQLVIKGNQSLLLDDPQKVWLIESGSIELFAVKTKDSVPDSRRRYLFNLETGEALFGTNPEIYSLLATSVETAIIRPLNWGAEGAGGTRGQGQGDKGDKKDKGDGGDGGDKEQPSTLYHQPSTITLAQKWIEHFTIFPDVVPPDLTVEPSASLTWDTLQSHLAHLHHNFCHYLKKQEEEENAQKIAQFQARERLDRQITAEAIGELASLIKPQPQESFLSLEP